MLSAEQADKEIALAESMTAGAWAEHSRTVARAARTIAEKCGMDGEKAYVFGLLHDIGRRKGSWDIRHVFDGYEYMIALGEPSIARICLTHSYPKFDGFDEYLGLLSCSDEQREFLRGYLADIEYDTYDELIQLCDSISLPVGVCIMEKRLVDVALRHGVHKYAVSRWRVFMEIKRKFDGMCGCNIYSLFPETVDNSLKDL